MSNRWVAGVDDWGYVTIYPDGEEYTFEGGYQQLVFGSSREELISKLQVFLDKTLIKLSATTSYYMYTKLIDFMENMCTTVPDLQPPPDWDRLIRKRKAFRKLDEIDRLATQLRNAELAYSRILAEGQL